MRLLHYTDDRELGWTDLIADDKLPPYAILSHTWGGQEVTFDDLQSHKGKDKAGFKKIQFCAQQAERDSLHYFWVDTCCIDKSSSAELSEAINSMFRWYHNAERCYVYLADVSSSSSDGDGEETRRWKPAFRKSRWFTRGWTLQELIAPTSVEFFSKEEERLGDKKSLEQTIHEITGIPLKALRGSPPSEFSKDDRFSWAASRQTTRKEDEAYCLLGIFDLQIPLLYGEGREKAMKRLQKEVWGDLPASPAHDVQSDSRRRDETADKIHRWLSPPDPSTNYQKALEQRQDDTGLWFLESDRYVKWTTDAASFLWLYGIPGCGKTILSSAILKNVLQHCNNNPQKVVAYFYFDFNDMQKQKPELMLRSLICQLLQQCLKIPASLGTRFSSRGNEQPQQPSLHALVKIMRQIAQELPHVYIVLDALDECSERTKLMDIIETISTWKLQNLHVLVTSRRERDIQSSLAPLIDQKNSICLQSEVVDVDIHRYVQQRLSKDKRLSKWGKDLALSEEIEAALMKGAHGMFRWAVCQLDTLGECRTRATLRKSLATLPPTLDKTYDRILSAISEADSQYAVTILQWLTFSIRPLSIYEVAEIVAIDVKNEPKFDCEGILEDPLDVLSICSSLVNITIEERDRGQESGRQVVALAHYSVKEYLLSDRIWKGSAARYGMQDIACHDNIAKGCLGYLLQFQGTQLLTQETAENFKLAKYCAEFWMKHAQGTKEQAEGFSQAAMDLLLGKSDVYLNWLRIHDPDNSWRGGSDFKKDLASVSVPLYYASRFGLRKIVKLLLDRGADVNVQGGDYGNALQAAAFIGHKEMVELLVSKGADVNLQGGHYGNTLQAAACRGHKETVELLVSKGADVNLQGGVYGNALCAAADRGHKEIVELLISKGADVNLQGGFYGNALQAAVDRGHKEIVDLLISKGADVNLQGGFYGNALQAAVDRGHKEIVDLLVSKGADVNLQGGHYGNALQAAAAGSHKETVELLVSKGAVTFEKSIRNP